MLQVDTGHMQQFGEIRKRQGPENEGHELERVPAADGPAAREILRRGEPLWVRVAGDSMRPAWPEGALLLIQPAVLRQILPGDCVVYESSGQLIAHRLLRRSLKEKRFQTKPDAGCSADIWQPSDVLIGRVAAIVSNGRVQPVAGWAAWRNRLIGLRQSLHIRAHEAFGRTSRVARHEGAASGTRDPTDAIWAKNLVLKEHLTRAVELLRPIGCEPVVLKGQALIAAGLASSDTRDMGDVDILIPRERVSVALETLRQKGWTPLAPKGASRADLDDQSTFRDPEGVLFDIHWNIVTGGWRFRGVIRPDPEGLHRRARSAGNLRVLSWEDLLLHQCMHLILSGATGKGWGDLESVLKGGAGRIDFALAAARASEWRVKNIVWLALDTLWRRGRVPVPVPLVRAVRPAAWRRVVLRRLLPQDLSEDIREPRCKRHLRELLLMDRRRDRLSLAARWMIPPRAWFAFRTGPPSN